MIDSAAASFSYKTGYNYSMCSIHLILHQSYSEVICMKPEIKKIATRSALFFGILAVSVAGMQLANLRNQQNAPYAVAVSAGQSPVIVLDAGHVEST